MEEHFRSVFRDIEKGEMIMEERVKEMTDEEMADEYVKEEGFRSGGVFGELDDITSSEANKEIKRAYLAGLKAGSQLDKVWQDYDPGEGCYEDSHEGKWVKREASEPKWHKVADGDLPPVHSTVFNEDCDKVAYIGEGKWETYSEYYERYVEIEPPIAWCEKPE